jgi:DNA modification methylase
MTSPPYFGLRDYGHPQQIGLESNVGEYVDALVGVFREVRRVLRDDGTLWINIGDSYGGSGRGSVGKTGLQHRNVGSISNVVRQRQSSSPKKQLVGVPWRVAFALQDDGWILRSDIIWQKTNPLPESVKDRPTKSHEYLFLLAKSERYYYDAAAISEPVADSTVTRLAQDVDAQQGSLRVNGGRARPMKAVARDSWKWSRFDTGKTAEHQLNRMSRTHQHDAAKFADVDDPSSGRRNKRDVWTISPQPFKESHFAVMPEALAEPCVLAGAPEGGIVLDPFCGAGTTGVVALRHQRSFIGIELNPEYADMAKRRIEDDQPLFNHVEIAA